MSNLQGNAMAATVRQHSGMSFMYSAMTAIEKFIVEEFHLYFALLKEIGHYTEDVDITAAYARTTELQHCIIVEAGLQGTDTEAINKNGVNKSILLEDGSYKEFQERSGQWTFQLKIYMRSTTKAAVAILADALYIGLQTNIYNRLASRFVNLGFNKVKMSNFITPKKIAGDVQMYEINFDIADVRVPWVLITEINGDIIQNFGFTREDSETIANVNGGI